MKIYFSSAKVLLFSDIGKFFCEKITFSCSFSSFSMKKALSEVLCLRSHDGSEQVVRQS
jgi:hypothetical protein